MHIILKKKITDYIKLHPDSNTPLLSWYAIANAENFSDFNDLRNWFPHADLVGRRTVFNIGGNKYRMITRVNFISHKIFILKILPHAEYSKDKWK